MSPLRFACVNVVLALTVAIALKALGLPLPSPAPAPIRDALRAWVPDRGSRGTLKALSDDLARVDEWAEGKRRYAETLAVLRPSAPLPPAGAGMPAPFSGTARILVIATERELPKDVRIELRYPGDTEGESLSAPPVLLGPFWQSVQLDMRLGVSEFFGLVKRQSEWRSVALGESAQAIVEFPEAAEWAPSARLVASWLEGSALDDAAHEGFAPEVLDADIVDDRADWSLPWRSGAARPRVQKLSASGSFRNAATVEVRGRRRYVGLCVWSPSGRLPLVRARRSDTQQFVGARAPDVPLFAVMADRYAAIQVEVAARNARDLADMQMVVVTSDDPPGLPLFVETIGRALAPLRSNGVTMNAAAQRRAGLWLRQVLGVEWEQRDVDAIAASDEELAAILASLR